MNKSKTIDEILSSICSLVNEAKNEYDKILIDNNKVITNQDNKLKNSYQFKEKITVSEPVLERSIDEVNFKKEVDKNSWNKINFRKNQVDKASASLIKQADLREIDMIQERFKEILSDWVDKNLKNLIELEFVNLIRNKKN